MKLFYSVAQDIMDYDDPHYLVELDKENYESNEEMLLEVVKKMDKKIVELSKQNLDLQATIQNMRMKGYK